MTTTLAALAEQLEDLNAVYMNTGGNVMVTYIPLTPEATYPVGFMVSDDYNEDGDLAVGVYQSEDDDGAILKEWPAEVAEEDALVIRSVIVTFTQTGGGPDA
jgi:hypothetical protein